MVVPTLCNNGTFGTILNLQSAQKRARNTTVVGRMPLLWNKYYVTVFHKIMHRHHFASKPISQIKHQEQSKIAKVPFVMQFQMPGLSMMLAGCMIHDA